VKRAWVYIMTNVSGTLYTGATTNLERRIYEHKHHLVPGFTSRYHLTMLAYVEEHPDVRQAIGREKQIKGWARAKKVALVETENPEWRDLSHGWYDG